MRLASYSKNVAWVTGGSGDIGDVRMRTNQNINVPQYNIKETIKDVMRDRPYSVGVEYAPNENRNIKPKIKEMIYNRTITNILKYEKIINNIEEIMMLINLQILENYYE
jgi:hypothetical protein